MTVLKSACVCVVLASFSWAQDVSLPWETDASPEKLPGSKATAPATPLPWENEPAVVDTPTPKPTVVVPPSAPVPEPSAAWVALDRIEGQSRRSLGKMAKKGDLSATYTLGWRYFFGKEDCKRDRKRSLKYLQPLAEKGYAEAQNMVGVCYKTGDGVRENQGKALSWFQKSAEQGYADSEAEMGRHWLYTERDSTKAEEWYQRAIEHGSVSAMVSLGKLHYQNKQDPERFKKALLWYQMAAEAGDAEGMRQWGCMADDGEGMRADPAFAFTCFKKAATELDTRNAKALHDLGFCYYKARGTSKDLTLALAYFEKAGNNGYLTSMYNSGVMHENGQGTDVDTRKALNWYKLAKKKGYEPTEKIDGDIARCKEILDEGFMKSLDDLGSALDDLAEAIDEL